MNAIESTVVMDFSRYIRKDFSLFLSVLYDAGYLVSGVSGVKIVEALRASALLSEDDVKRMTLFRVRKFPSLVMAGGETTAVDKAPPVFTKKARVAFESSAKPKRPLNGFMKYLNAQRSHLRDEILETDSDLSGRSLMTAVSKLASERWSAMSAEQKLQYAPSTIPSEPEMTITDVGVDGMEETDKEEEVEVQAPVQEKPVEKVQEKVQEKEEVVEKTTKKTTKKAGKKEKPVEKAEEKPEEKAEEKLETTAPPKPPRVLTPLRLDALDVDSSVKKGGKAKKLVDENVEEKVDVKKPSKKAGKKDFSKKSKKDDLDGGDVGVLIAEEVSLDDLDTLSYNATLNVWVHSESSYCYGMNDIDSDPIGILQGGKLVGFGVKSSKSK